MAHVTYEETFDNNDGTYDAASHYTYDIHGNVNTLLQENNNTGVTGQDIKRIDYTYDLISGNVHEVKYQSGFADGMIHKYRYDADNRITHVYTSTDGVHEDLDAKYFYYAHGPLARTELGNEKVQGVDYVYTLHGWIKGVNSNALDSTRDVGRDGNPIANNPNAGFAPDVFGYTLNYYDTVGISDYRPIDATNRWNTVTTRFESDKTGSDALAARKNLWNGNIGMMVTAIQNPSTYATLPQAMSYEYDQLNRLKVAKGFVNLNMATNTWQNGSTYNDRYYNAFSYDANGNILTQVRHNEAGTRVENLSYKYERDANGRLLRNRLYHVNETVSAGAFADDIDDQGVFTTSNINVNNNYGYDEEGRLIRDDQEDIQEIKWTVGSKVKEVIRTNGSPKKNLKFDYDAFGKRIAKHVYTSANVWESSTYYTYDATGNVMSIYEKKNGGAGITYHVAERHIYGSSRVGTIKERVELSGTITLPDTGNFVHHIGKKQYELNNHLGNVLSTISDRLIAKDWNSDNTTDSYKAEILSATDYTPFGVAMDGRTYAGGNSRYGFNGQEKDDDWNVDGGSYDFGDRIYDSRLARWMLQDPFSKRYASKSPYSTMSNSPLTIIDLNGDTITNVFYKQIYTYKEDGTFQVTTWKTIYINFEDGDPNSNTTYYWVEYEQYLTNGWSSSGNYRVSGEAQWQVEEDYRFSYNERHPKGVAANEYDMTKGSSDGGLMGKNKGNNGESIGETWEKMGGSNGYAPWNVLEEALKELLDGNGGTNGSEEAPDNSRKDEFRDPKTIKHGDTAIILDPSQQDGPGNVVVGDTTGEKTGSNGLKNVPVRIIRQASKADHQRFGSGVNK